MLADFLNSFIVGFSKEFAMKSLSFFVVHWVQIVFKSASIWQSNKRKITLVFFDSQCTIQTHYGHKTNIRAGQETVELYETMDCCVNCYHNGPVVCRLCLVVGLVVVDITLAMECNALLVLIERLT